MIAMADSTDKKSKQTTTTTDFLSRKRRIVSECEEKYGTIVEVLGDIIYKIDPDGLFLYLNNSIRNLDYDPSDLIGEHFSTIIHPDDVETVSRKIVLPKYDGKVTGPESAPKLFDERRSELRMTKNLELRLIPKNWQADRDDPRCRFCSLVTLGEVMATGQYRGDPAGTKEVFTGTVGIIRDITFHKEYESTLQKSEKKYRDLADFLPIPVFETDLNGTVTFANKVAFELFKYEQKDIEKGVNILDCLAPQDRKKASENIYRKFNGEEFSGTQFTALRKDGTTFPVILESCRITEGQTVLGLRGAILDISKLRQTEQALSESELKMEQERCRIEKLESIGVVTGGIAHDFNNFLTSILGNVSLVKTLVPPNSEMSSLCANTEHTLLQAAGLTRQLLTFAKEGVLATETCSINHLIRDSILFILRGSNVKANFSLADDLWTAKVDKTQIGQVIGNIVINAKQAIPYGGTIIVTAENYIIDTRDTVPLPPGRYINISIKDQGPGISRDNISKIFDPYFTTKKEGSGLGLALCYSIISKHNGHIAVKTEEGKGTTFSIFLPATGEKSCADNTPEETEPMDGKGRILLMDDAEIIRISVGKMISALGYDVELVAEGSEAVNTFKKAKEEGNPYDVIILDLTIPGGMGGEKTIAKLIKLDPRVKGIASSGYSNNPVMVDYKAYGFCAAIAKPYTLTKLSTTLHKLITG